MNNILIKSQDGKLTSFCRCIGIGQRQANGIIGDKLKSILETKGLDIEDLIKELGNSYRENAIRILNNNEIPNKSMLDKLIKIFNLENNYFEEKELENVIITDNGIVVGKYNTNVRTLEVKKELDKKIIEGYISGKPIILEMPNE